jgi:hypothetical protein
LSNQKDGDFCRTEDPLTKPFERIAGSFRFWDPDLFRDDGGRLYLYWVSSNHEPIYGSSSLLVCPLSNQKDGDFCRTEDPLTKPFERIAGSFRFWDPHDLFRDDGGRLYLYWVPEISSNHEPIYGVELDPDTMQPVCEKQGLIFPDSVGVRTCCACA